jgi:hypothetical protein
LDTSLTQSTTNLRSSSSSSNNSPTTTRCTAPRTPPTLQRWQPELQLNPQYRTEALLKPTDRSTLKDLSSAHLPDSSSCTARWTVIPCSITSTSKGSECPIDLNSRSMGSFSAFSVHDHDFHTLLSLLYHALSLPFLLRTTSDNEKVIQDRIKKEAVRVRQTEEREKSEV